MSMTISQQGIEFIKQHEGLRLSPYQCSAGKWTIAYGHTGSDTTQMGWYDGERWHKTITLEQAEALLRRDLEEFEECINEELYNTTLTQNQYDALVDFVYNIGTSAFRGSTLLKKIKSGAPSDVIASEFMKWDKAGKNADGTWRILEGLQKRRKAEVVRYFKA